MILPVRDSANGSRDAPLTVSYSFPLDSLALLALYNHAMIWHSTV